MPLLLCKAIHNIKQNIVPQMNFSSSILLFLFHIFGPDPEIIRFRYSEPKNSKSYSPSILLRTKKRKKKEKKENTRPINRIQSSKNPSRDFAKERRKKITDRAAAAVAEVAARVDTRIAHTGEQAARIARVRCTRCCTSLYVELSIVSKRALHPRHPPLSSVPHHVWTFAPPPAIFPFLSFLFSTSFFFFFPFHDLRICVGRNRSFNRC